jgi:hypothetical protein
MDNLIILQPITRPVAGNTRRLYLAYLAGGDERIFAPVILTEGEGRAVMLHVNRGCSFAIDGQLFKRVNVLEHLRVDAKEMKEYARLEGCQGREVKAAVKAGGGASAFLKLKEGAQNIQRLSMDPEPRAQYASAVGA